MRMRGRIGGENENRYSWAKKRFLVRRIGFMSDNDGSTDGAMIRQKEWEGIMIREIRNASVHDAVYGDVKYAYIGIPDVKLWHSEWQCEVKVSISLCLGSLSSKRKKGIEKYDGELMKRIWQTISERGLRLGQPAEHNQDNRMFTIRNSKSTACQSISLSASLLPCLLANPSPHQFTPHNPHKDADRQIFNPFAPPSPTTHTHNSTPLYSALYACMT